MNDPKCVHSPVALLINKTTTKTYTGQHTARGLACNKYRTETVEQKKNSEEHIS